MGRTLSLAYNTDRFEKAMNDLGRALGFSSERPDKAWKEGPDNLWALRDSEYLLMECKSEVLPGRAEINKEEVVQMIKASSWFQKNYKGVKVTRMMVIPTRNVGKAAAFTDEVGIMREKSVAKLVRNVKAFFGEFRAFDLDALSEAKVQQLLDAHSLGIDHLTTEYSEPVRVYG